MTKTSAILDRLSSLRYDTMYSAMKGDYKGFKFARKEYARLAVDNFELATQAKSPKVEGIPMFSKIGLNIMKVMFLNFFRIKTSKEKEFKEMYEEYLVKKQLGLD